MATGLGNTRPTARTVVLGSAVKNLKGLLSTKDGNDFWKFAVRNRSSLTVNLKTLSKTANADLQLMTATGRVLASSKQAKNRPDKISNFTLESGTFVVRVLRRAGLTRYALSLQTAAIPSPSPGTVPTPIPVPDPTPTPGPSPTGDPSPGPSPSPTPGLEDNTVDTSKAFQASAPINGFSGGSISDFVGDADTEDYLKFTASNAGQLKFQLSGLLADADIQLFDANRTLIAPAAGDTNDSITKIIGANEVGSTFYIRVFQAAAGQNTNYTLDLSLLPVDTVGNDTLTATSLNLIPNAPNSPRVPISQSEFVGGGDVDVYAFDLTAQAFVGLDLTTLSGNADVSLHRANPPGVPGEEYLLRSIRPGTSAEQLGGTLSPGRYFLRVSTPGDLTPSPYSFSLFAESTTGIPTLTRDISYGQAGANVRNLTNVNGTLFFSADNDEGSGSVLWKSTGGGTGSGGTLDRTSKVSEIGFTSLSSFANVNNTLYFSANDGAGQSGLWKSDGSSVQFIGNILNPTNLTAVGDKLYFIAPTLGGPETDLRLWSSDGTSAAEVTYDNPLTPEVEALAAGLFPTNLVNVAGTLFYVATDPTSASDPNFKGRELWRINSTTGQPELIDINQDSTQGGGAIGQSNLSKLTAIGDSLYFVGTSTGRIDQEAMRLKITGATYNPLTDLAIFDADNAAFTSSLPTLDDNWNFAAVGNAVYFATNLSNKGELYKVENDVLTRVRTDPNSVIVESPRNLTAFNGKLLFKGVNPSTAKEELWVTDGTDAGTIQLIVPDRPAGAKPIDELVVAGTKFFFTMEGVNNGSLTGKELWTSDGTVNGTQLVYDIYPGTTTIPADPNDPFSVPQTVANSADVENLINVNGQLFFTANNGLNGEELWSVF
jgi:ELWxxDGT repeat protein